MPFTKLEKAVLSALAWDLRRRVPDLASQVEDSRPGARRNTGTGLFTAISIAGDGSLPLSPVNDRLGTVHAMVGTLPDPIAFQVDIHQGRLVALHGDAYGQDTRAIDFQTVAFDQVFTVDADGRSIAYDRDRMATSAPVVDVYRPSQASVIASSENLPPPMLTDTRLVFGENGAVRPASPTIDRSATSEDEAPPLTGEDRTSLIAGTSAIIVAVAVIAYFVFDIPLFVLILAGGWALSMLRKPKVVDTLATLTRDWRTRTDAAQ